jgi:hypothetical protein
MLQQAEQSCGGAQMTDPQLEDDPSNAEEPVR